MEHFLKKSVDKLFVYHTPKKIIDFIMAEIIVKNPPYDPPKT
jgi:hypothetical protein